MADEEILDYDEWEDLTEYFDTLPEDTFEENNPRRETILDKLPEDDLIFSADIGEDSITVISDDSDSEQENTVELPLEIISRRNSNVIPKLISVLSGKENLCRKSRSKTKWLMEYNKLQGQKPKATPTDAKDSTQWKANGNGSALVLGLMATNILCFALGFGIGWWNREVVPTYAIFEFDLDSVVQ